MINITPIKYTTISKCISIFYFIFLSSEKYSYLHNINPFNPIRHTEYSDYRNNTNLDLCLSKTNSQSKVINNINNSTPDNKYNCRTHSWQKTAWMSPLRKGFAPYCRLMSKQLVGKRYKLLRKYLANFPYLNIFILYQQQQKK